MQINRCVGCEGEIGGYPCPHCGFDLANYQHPEYALPYNSILHGRYLIGKVLGQGGFGITYIGWDLALEIKVAIKEYYPSGQVTRNRNQTLLCWYSNPQAVSLRKSGMATFMREARKMARLDRIPQVVRVRDTFAENETAYIIMDFVEGETLKNRLEHKGPMSWEKAKAIFFPVMEAMEQVHQAGLVHRDLSPDNLMLLPNGDVSILDLGAAKDLSVNTGISSMQVIKGGFSPIEQYGQTGGSGPWTDVYALAATLYYTLTGCVPPTSVDRLGSASVRWDLPALQTLPPKALDAMKKAMAITAAERTQSMGAMLGQMREKPKKENVPARPLGRKPLAAGAAAFAVVLLMSGFLMFKPTRTPVKDVAAGLKHTLILRTDGTVAASGDNDNGQCNVDGWTNIAAIAASGEHSIGLRNDGTLVAAGDNQFGQCNVDGYFNIVAVSTGVQHTVVLNSHGMVMAAGRNRYGQNDVSSWSQIKAISAGSYHTVGLRGNGTVVACGNNADGQCNVGTWRYIEEVEAGEFHTVGLKSDGTVVAVGSDQYGQCAVSDWRNIVDIAVGRHCTFGLQSDGTVVATGNTNGIWKDAMKWSDIATIDCGGEHAVAIKYDGTAIAAGNNACGQCRIPR